MTTMSVTQRKQNHRYSVVRIVLTVVSIIFVVLFIVSLLVK